MSKTWATMTHAELKSELAAGRAEAAQRMQDMAELMGMAQPSGKPGRPAKNQLAAYLNGGAGQDSENEDAASGATQ
jgi:hypothetical protein